VRTTMFDGIVEDSRLRRVLSLLRRDFKSFSHCCNYGWFRCALNHDLFLRKMEKRDYRVIISILSRIQCMHDEVSRIYRKFEIPCSQMDFLVLDVFSLLSRRIQTRFLSANILLTHVRNSYATFVLRGARERVHFWNAGKSAKLSEFA
jgi:CII-binding regulator of phage lambda lysogenization HflD